MLRRYCGTGGRAAAIGRRVGHRHPQVGADATWVTANFLTRKIRNREQEISAISRALKGMAKELKVPVIALSQLSRAVETRGGDKRPQLSDLRESGAIEQDADIVTFIYRPDYYALADGVDMPDNIAEIILAKHRNGSLGTVNLRFLKEYVKFVDDDSSGFRNMPGQEGEDIFGDGGNSFITRPSRLNTDTDDIFFDA